MKKMKLAEKAKKVIELQNDTPDGVIHDADTVLEDILDEREVYGDAEELIGIWQNSSDKDSVAAVFACITGVTFEDYLDRCIAETTRKNESDRERSIEEQIKEDAKNTFMQECNSCGKRFRILYKADGSYIYIDQPCLCDSAFSPCDGAPSITEWLNKEMK